MKYYAVIDTNVVISSMLKKTSIPGQVLDYVADGTIIPLLNEEILDEYEEVLSRNNFGFSEKAIADITSLFRETGVFLERTQTAEKFPDPDDAVFYEIVMTARKTEGAYLVTGNSKHFPVKPFVVSAREMIDIIEGIMTVETKVNNIPDTVSNEVENSED